MTTSIEEGGFIGGVLALAHRPNMPRISRVDLESLLSDWRSIHLVPDNITDRDESLQHSGPELQGVDLSGTDLSSMDLRYIKLTHCNLKGAKLNSTRLDGAFLFGCDLSHIESWVASFRSTSFRQCYIANSRFMHGHFEGASFAYSNLQNTKLINSYHDRDTWFYRARLYCTDLSEAHLEKVNLEEASTLFGVCLHLARLDGTEIDFELFHGKIGEELSREFVQAAKAYMAIKSNLDARGYYGTAGRAYVKERQMKQQASAPWNARRCYGEEQLGDKYEYSQEQNKLVRTEMGVQKGHPKLWWFYFKHIIKWSADWFVDLLCGYGESIGRVLAWIVAILLFIGPALVGLLGGLEWTGNNRDVYFSFPASWQRWLYAYFQYVLYMIDTVTTASFAELKPVNDSVRLASGFMALFGIFLAGLLGFVTGNRIRRS